MKIKNSVLLKHSFCILFLIISGFLSGQNLVPNGSFELYRECPEDYSKNYYLKQVQDWESPNSGTPDYFNACSYKCGVPLNWVGRAEAYDGKAYMGIIACMQQFDPHQIAYREYIRATLTDSLKAGSKYFVSMQVQLGLSCSISCNGLGIFISATPLNSHENINYPVNADIIYNNNEIIDIKDSWTQVCGSYIANGDEKYIIIGNFLSNQQMQFQVFDENFIQTPNISPMAYYYIDDVKLEPYVDSIHGWCISEKETKPEVFNGELTAKKRMVLKSLYFETDKDVILSESFDELDQLAIELRRNPNYKISIFGHTDNIGDDEYNQILSEKRAIAVRNYLLGKGVSKFRITTQGFGKSQPISENSTVEGMQLNRRVEIEVY